MRWAQTHSDSWWLAGSFDGCYRFECSCDWPNRQRLAEESGESSRYSGCETRAGSLASDGTQSRDTTEVAVIMQDVRCSPYRLGESCRVNRSLAGKERDCLPAISGKLWLECCCPNGRIESEPSVKTVTTGKVTQAYRWPSVRRSHRLVPAGAKLWKCPESIGRKHLVDGR